MSHNPLDFKSQSTMSYGKQLKSMIIGKNSLKKRKESKRNDNLKSSRKNFRKTAANLWIPRVRHNYVPTRPNSYTINTHSPQPKLIPFVCGQSISKTHNIGLKIQESLNAIKQEKSKNNSMYKNQYPRIYSHDMARHTFQNPEISCLTVRPPPMSKRKPVDMNLLKAVFLELYEDLTKMLDNLQELRNNSRNPDSLKMAEDLEAIIKRKELQISVMMALYKELMCLRKALGIKTDKRLSAKHLSSTDEVTRRQALKKNIKEFEGGDH